MSRPDEEREQATWSRAFQSTGAPQSMGSCPPAERICDAVDAKLDPAEVRLVVEHCATCPHCAEDWRVARSMADDLSDEIKAPKATSVLSIEPIRKRWKQWGAGFGLCAVAALALLVVWPREERSVPTMRGGEESTASAIESYRFDGTTFYWPQLNERARYELLLNDMNFATIATVDGIEGTQFVLSDELRVRLESESEFYWQIRVWGDDGKSVLSLPIHQRATP